jgi:acetyl esterase/lipase
MVLKRDQARYQLTGVEIHRIYELEVDKSGSMKDACVKALREWCRTTADLVRPKYVLGCTSAAFVLLTLSWVSGCQPTPSSSLTIATTVMAPPLIASATISPTPALTLTRPLPTLLPTTPAVPPLARAGELPLVYHVPDMDKVSVQSDVAYQTTARGESNMDIYYPTGSQYDDRHPAVILVHGNAPGQQNLKATVPFVSWGRLIAASGLSAVTFNRRGSTPDDITDLLTYVQDHAETLRIDKDRVCVLAFSAGVPPGFTATMAGPHDFVRCFVAYYGDMRVPLSQLRQGSIGAMPPMLIVQAARDEIIPGESIDEFVNAALERGLAVEHLVHPAGVHAFDLRNDDDQSREIIKQTIGFIQSYLELGPITGPGMP